MSSMGHGFVQLYLDPPRAPDHDALRVYRHPSAKVDRDAIH